MSTHDNRSPLTPVDAADALRLIRPFFSEALEDGFKSKMYEQILGIIDRGLSAPSSVLTREEAAEAAKAIRNGMNPATPAMFFPQGWNVILDKLDAIALGAPAFANVSTKPLAELLELAETPGYSDEYIGNVVRATLTLLKPIVRRAQGE
jgi:hypothetical protein